METQKVTILNYVKSNTFKESSLINESTKIFQEGFFDSMGFVLLIDFLQEKFGVVTNDEDLIEENFESVSAIDKYITHKLNH